MEEQIRELEQMAADSSEPLSKRLTSKLSAETARFLMAEGVDGDYKEAYAPLVLTAAAMHYVVSAHAMRVPVETVVEGLFNAISEIYPECNIVRTVEPADAPNAPGRGQTVH